MARWTDFNEEFDAHDALEDIKALRRILFFSPLKLTDDDIVNKSNPRPALFAHDDMKFLDERFERVQTFRRKLYFPGTWPSEASRYTKNCREWSPILRSKRLVLKGLVAVLSMAPSNANSLRSPRGSRIHNILAQIVLHFENFWLLKIHLPRKQRLSGTKSQKTFPIYNKHTYSFHVFLS